MGAEESSKCYDKLEVAVDSGLSCQCALPLMLVLTMSIWQWSWDLAVRLGACRCSAGGASRRLAQWYRLVIEDQAESGPTCSYRRPISVHLIAAQSLHRHVHSCGAVDRDQVRSMQVQRWRD